MTKRRHLQIAWETFLEEYWAKKLGPEGLDILTEDACQMIAHDLKNAFFWGARAQWVIERKFTTEIENTNGPN
jgi:hypothetical protein